MGLKITVGLMLPAIVLSYSYVYYLLIKNPEVPELEETWWGEGDSGRDDIGIRPFQIDVSKQVSDKFF